MQHLFSITVHHAWEEIEYLLRDADGLSSLDASGIELLTGYDSVDPIFTDVTKTVHLPYAVDWYGPYSGKRPVPENLDPFSVKYQHYGRNHEEIVETLRTAIDIAAPLKPDHGVLHASSADINQLMTLDSSDGNANIVSALAELMNEVVSVYPDGEPPFSIVFENTWWPGLKMADSEMYRIFDKKLEFSNWGLCLDTGHLLVSLRASTDEEKALELLNTCADRYPIDMIEKITAMHLHVNTSAEVLKNIPTAEESIKTERNERIKKASELISAADMHLPFTNPEVKEFVNRINPKSVIHEMGSMDLKENIAQYAAQRSLL